MVRCQKHIRDLVLAELVKFTQIFYQPSRLLRAFISKWSNNSKN